MNCSEIAEIAPLYRSGELGPHRTAAFTAHLATCPDCARDLRDEERLDALLRAAVLAEVVDTGAVKRRVRERVAADAIGSRRATPRIWRPRWRGAAIGAVAVLVLSIVGYRHLSRPHSVYADAAADHRSEVVDAHWRPWLTDPTQIAGLAQRGDIAPGAVLALAPPGYHPSRAKLCRLDGRLFLHVVYSNGLREFSMYLRPSQTGSVVPLYTTSFGSEHVGCVESPGMMALIVTDESAAAAVDLARFAGSTLALPPASNF